MAELREDSLLFSLETLMVRERERVQLERAEAERQRAVEAAAASAREKQRLEAALERERRLEQERVAEQNRLVEHAAKLEALRQAELLRAQTEAKARADMEILAQRQAHERSLAEISARQQKTRDRTLALGSGTLLSLFVPAALLFHFAHTLPQTRQRESDLQNLVSAERSRAEEASRLLVSTETKRRELAAELSELRTRPAPTEARPVANSTPTPARPGRPERVTATLPHSKKPCRDSGDPLDPCLH